MRLQDESLFDYKHRRILSKQSVKMMKKGIVFWDSGKFGAYINPKRQNKKITKRQNKKIKNRMIDG